MPPDQAASQPLHTFDVPQRFLITLAAQISKSALSFLTGMIVARGLGPVEYGNLAFLLGSFAGLRLLLDMSTGQAFFTLAAQKQRSRSFYVFYGAWLLVAEILLPLLFLPLAIPIVVGGVGASVTDDPSRYVGFLALYDALFAIICWASFEYVVTE